MFNTNKEFYTLQDVADLLRVDRATIRKYIKNGKLKAYKVGRVFRIKREDIDFLLQPYQSKTKEDTNG